MKVSLAATSQVEDETTDFKPTDEQVDCINKFKKGNSLSIEAGAGCGKTATLKLMAESMPERSGQFTAFNKAIVTDAEAMMPSSCKVKTAHGLAWQAIIKNDKFRANRLASPRVKYSEIAKKLGIKNISLKTPFSEYEKIFESWKLAGHVKNAVDRFCQSGDKEPSVRHFTRLDGIDKVDQYENNNRIARDLLPAAKAMWEDLQSKTGWAKFDHAHYLKIWELSGPDIDADYILVDEAQDLSGVLLSVVQQQKDAQRVYVGDNAQEIYTYLGCENALKKVKVDARAVLSQSFRFGDPIAVEANHVLEYLEGCKLRLKGNPALQSYVGPVSDPFAILCRTNATAVEGILTVPNSHLIGGGEDVIRQVEALEELRSGKKTIHPDFQCFDTWEELEEYIADDSGSDLKLIVTLFKRFGGKAIIAALRNMPSIRAASRVYSTAHKVKGLGFDSVQLASDFGTLGTKCTCKHSRNSHSSDSKCKQCKCSLYTRDNPSQSELRLLYVAMTRAKLKLDRRVVAFGTQVLRPTA